tara:strand:+ start:1539 stop:1925 length:387 start_codon:yes stop_codon:yes gene_type:complete
MRQRNIIRKGGVNPLATKYSIQSLIKTREMDDYLSNKVPMQSDKLKIRLINEGYLDPECDICRRSLWVGEDIPLQLDHVDGNNDDNSLENLRLLCPNCHAQTPQYRLKNEFKDTTYSNKDKENPNTDQ